MPPLCLNGVSITCKGLAVLPHLLITLLNFHNYRSHVLLGPPLLAKDHLLAAGCLPLHLKLPFFKLEMLDATISHIAVCMRGSVLVRRYCLFVMAQGEMLKVESQLN